MQHIFGKIAKLVTRWAGSPTATLLAFATIAIWFAGGFFFGFSDTYQLYINTGTTIVTFLMVFLIQNTQNRDTEALQVKLDELIFVIRKADNTLLDLEEMDEKELNMIRDRYEEMARKARKESGRRGMPTGTASDEEQIGGGQNG